MQGPAGPAAAPGGTIGNVQFNDDGILRGEAGFTYDKAPKSLSGGMGSSAPGAQSVAWGDRCTASGDQSFAGSKEARAQGHNSFAWGHDVLTENTYGASLGAHISNRGVASVAIGENLSCGLDSPNSVVVGFQNTVAPNTPFAVALGSYVNVAEGAIGALATGLNATAARPGQFQHSSGVASGAFAGTAWMDLYTKRERSPGALADLTGRPFVLDPSSYAVVTVDLLAVTANGAKRAFETRTIEVLCADNGAVSIVSENIIKGAGNLAAQGWSFAVTSPASRELRFAVDPGSDTVAFGARISWTQMGSLYALP